MVILIAGTKGKGKTKHLLNKVSSEVKEANGNIVFLDDSMQHMHELNNKVRLINMHDYPISNADEFFGFLCGIISQDNDLEQMYLDHFLIISKLNDEDIAKTIEKIVKMSVKFRIDFIISISKAEADLPESIRQFVSISL